MTNKYSRLLGNSILFTIGNLGSKLITFLMLPLYTYKLTTEEFGATDLIQTTAGLLIPIIYLSIFDAVLRFGMEKNIDEKKILVNALSVTCVSSIVCIFLTLILNLLGIHYSIYLGIILIVQGFQNLFSQYAKAIGKVRLFAINGMLLSGLIAVFNIILLVIFSYGVQGFFMSMILANILSNIYLIMKLNIIKEIDINKFDLDELLKMLKFSIPLIPNSIAWWMTNTVSRYFVLFFIGVTANGIFAVANKIPALLSVVNSIFFQSWQLSAIEEYDSNDSNEFFSNIYKNYTQFLFLGASVIIAVIKPILKIVVSESFYVSWKYVPFLILAIVYSSLAGFLGQNYIAAKNTSQIFTTTIIGAILNIVLNILLLPIIGLQGAGISSAISFAVVWIYRQKNSQKFIQMDVNINNQIINSITILLQSLSLLILHGLLGFIIQFIWLFIIGIINRELLSYSFSIILKRIRQ